MTFGDLSAARSTRLRRLLPAGGATFVPAVATSDEATGKAEESNSSAIAAGMAAFKSFPGAVGDKAKRNDLKENVR